MNEWQNFKINWILIEKRCGVKENVLYFSNESTKFNQKEYSWLQSILSTYLSNIKLIAFCGCVSSVSSLCITTHTYRSQKLFLLNFNWCFINYQNDVLQFWWDINSINIILTKYLHLSYIRNPNVQKFRDFNQFQFFKSFIYTSNCMKQKQFLLVFNILMFYLLTIN